MTISSQVKQTLATIKGIEAVIKQYAETSQNLEAKEIWEKQIPRAANIVNQLEKRIQTLEREEPQYKGY
jgi:DNA mismatch repair ATPase MutS